MADERVESLVRAMVDHFAAMGGVPLLAVFDRPKTVALAWDREGRVTDWNPVFAGVAMDLGLGVELCWPYRPEQKGSLENLVGWVKGSFFKQRRFLDDEDLVRQLGEWLEEVNGRRPSRATGVVPAVRLAEERPRLRPLKVAPAELALRIPVYVGHTGVVTHEGRDDSMAADAIGIAGMLFLYRETVRIVAGRFEATHRRLFEPGARSMLPEHRAQHVAAVSGRRAKRYLQREHLLALGPAALDYLTELTHRRPRIWVRDVERLHLAHARRVWRDLVQRAETHEWSYRDFLALLAAEEVAQRQQTRVARLTHRARFPFLKTIDDFDFTYQSTVRLALLGSALSPDFVTEGRSLILSGKPGRGKTHLAVAIAYRAIQNGFDAVFVTAAEMIDDLSIAFREGRLAAALPRYAHPAVLVVDEVGYLTYGTDAANVLFHVVNDRHRRRRSMVFTTNKPLEAWGKVLHDPDLAHAIVDRVLERGRLLRLDGPSLRTRHLGLDDPTLAEAASPVARISGNPSPEFPEPTNAPRQLVVGKVEPRRI